MKRYICVKIKDYAEDTEEMLNNYASYGWRVVCSYASRNSWIILEKDEKSCSKCGKKLKGGK